MRGTRELTRSPLVATTPRIARDSHHLLLRLRTRPHGADDPRSAPRDWGSRWGEGIVASWDRNQHVLCTSPHPLTSSSTCHLTSSRSSYLAPDNTPPLDALVSSHRTQPNIPSHPPPSYTPLQSFPALLAPLLATLSSPPLNSPTSTTSAIFPTPTTLGLKLPPYTHIGQFNDLVAYLGTIPQGGVSYLACCNTLGGVIGFGGDLCLSEDADAGNEQGDAGLEVGRFAGMAGEAIHPLALGFVHSLVQSLLLICHGSD